MALKNNSSQSPLKTGLKSEPSGYRTNKQNQNKANYTPKKVASGNVSSGEMTLKTEPSTGGLKG
jgi:hypothetical protein